MQRVFAGGEPIRLALVGWPAAVDELPAPVAWSEAPDEAWRLFDRQVAELGRWPWPALEGLVFVLTTRIDPPPLGFDRRRFLPLRGRSDWVQCVRGCAQWVCWREGGVAERSCPICGGGLRPWVHFGRDRDWVAVANAGAEDRLEAVVASLRGHAVELLCYNPLRERLLIRLVGRLRRQLNATVEVQ